MSVSEEILKGRFVKRVFSETSVDIDKSVGSEIRSRGFSDATWGMRSFHSSDSALTYQHLGKHRFVDMKTRNTPKGKKRKKNHAIHNRIIFGHYNNVIRELKYGFTDAVKEELLKLED